MASLGHAANLVAWVHLYLTALLIGWVLLVIAATGWQPVVVTGASMSPTLRVGDLLLVDQPADELVGQRTIITYPAPDGDGLVTHRVFEVRAEAGQYVTKGDANADPDTDLVPAAEVVGVGRMVVPFVGLPVVWAGRGQAPALVAAAVLSAAAVAVALQGRGRGDRPARTADDATAAAAGRAVGRVRWLMAILVVAQFLVGGADPAAPVALGLPALAVTAGAVLVLLATNAVALRIRPSAETSRRRWELAELAVDTVLVVVLTSVTGASGIGWILMVLPIVEAAVRFGLAGALMHWLILASVTVMARLWSLEGSDASSAAVVEGLGELVDQLAVLLLVAIPGAYLAEQLLGDVAEQRRATDAAVERGRLLARVTEGGHEVNQLGGDLFRSLQAAVLDLGFDGADVILWPAGGRWQYLTEDPAGRATMPVPERAGSGLRLADLGHAEVIVDHDDPEPTETAALDEHGLAALVRLTLSRAGDQLVLLRAARRRPIDDPAMFEALRLLCAQAAVALQNKELVATLEGLHDEMAHQATHDELTGLPNRARFVHAVQEAVAVLGRGPGVPAVLFLDLNGFKGVNDRLGHEAGDELLRQVAGRLDERVGSAGLAARLGGDEFTVLLPRIEAVADALDVASRIHAGMLDPFMLPRGSAMVGASIGVAVAERGIDDTELLRRADVAMYTAKETGGSTRTAVFDPTMDESARRRGRLVSELQRAFDSGELELAYQPLVRADSGVITGAEALLRWRHRELGPIAPAEVLELARAAGRLPQLNAWILSTALGGLASCALAEDQEFTMSVNASPVELAADWLVPHVLDALTLNRIRPDRLIVEVSERVVVDESTAADAAAVADLGVGLALDDFGQGRTSLAHLRGLPIDQLKVDQRLVHQAVTAAADMTIFQSVVDLAHDLGFAVVAEGVETARHVEVAMAAGADLLQGYHLHRPMPIDQLRSLLAEQRRNPGNPPGRPRDAGLRPLPTRAPREVD